MKYDYQHQLQNLLWAGKKHAVYINKYALILKCTVVYLFVLCARACSICLCMYECKYLSTLSTPSHTRVHIISYYMYVYLYPYTNIGTLLTTFTCGFKQLPRCAEANSIRAFNEI